MPPGPPYESAADAGRQAREHDDAERLAVGVVVGLDVFEDARAAGGSTPATRSITVMRSDHGTDGRGMAGLKTRRHDREDRQSRAEGRLQSRRHCLTEDHDASDPVHVSAIIAAGGRGARLGAGRPKQLLLARRPADPAAQRRRAARRTRRFATSWWRCRPSSRRRRRRYLLGREKPLVVVEGGDRRQDSVANAFARVPAHADVVVIHDAARPLVSADLIDRTIAAAIGRRRRRGRRSAPPTR